MIKLGILVVAYNAESTIEKTLLRIPEIFADQIFSILISDDASVDLTPSKAKEFAKNSKLPIEIAVQRKNLGYGGNQKFGYKWAIENNLDYIILLHADGQYAPEFLPKIYETLVTSNVSAVFGSRMLNKKNALKGGMPLYKWVGNQILSNLQNFLAGQSFSEWHSGFRAYQVNALRKINFEKLSDGFRFDTQIILEILRQDGKIIEVEIPTFYGEEISHVNGFIYALEIIWDTCRYSFEAACRKLRK
jgi:glycosyltransferase involved in cell wall biosynthesis